MGAGSVICDVSCGRMKKGIIIVAIALVVYFVLPDRWFGRDPSSRLAAQSVARGDFRFLALVNSDHTKTLPEVPGIPAWYFETTGTKPLNVPPKVMGPEVLQDIKGYNDALLLEIKAQGKFHILEEDIARVKAELESDGRLQKTN